MDGRKKRTNLKMNIIGWSIVWEHKHGMDECSNAEVGYGDLEVQRSRGHDLHEDI
jgi:hypothetical protein